MLNLCHHLSVRELQTIQLHRSSLGTRLSFMRWFTSSLYCYRTATIKQVYFFSLEKLWMLTRDRSPRVLLYGIIVEQSKKDEHIEERLNQVKVKQSRFHN